MSQFLRKLSIALASTVVTLSAQAGVLTNNTGLTGPFVSENFNVNAGHGSLAGSQFNFLTFGAGNYVDNGYNGSFPNMQGSVIDNFGAGCCTAQTTITFGGSVSDLAFAFVTNPGTSTFTALLGGNVVESFSVNTGYDGRFYGFTGIAFDSIRIQSGGGNNAYVLDNLQYRMAAPAADVPEPASLALLGMGLAAVSLVRRRKK